MSEFRQFMVEKEQGVTLLTLLEARVHDHAAIKEIGDELNRLTADELAHRILFDMKDVDFLSSAVLNRLIVLDKQLKNFGGQIAFCHLRPQIEEVFSITKLNKLFPIYESRQEAVAAMSAESAEHEE